MWVSSFQSSGRGMTDGETAHIRVAMPPCSPQRGERRSFTEPQGLGTPAVDDFQIRGTGQVIPVVGEAVKPGTEVPLRGEEWKRSGRKKRDRSGAHQTCAGGLRDIRGADDFGVVER